MKIDNKNTQELEALPLHYKNSNSTNEPFRSLKGLSSDKTNIKAWNGVGVTYRLMGDNNSALKCFYQILNIDSHEIQGLDKHWFLFIRKYSNSMMPSGAAEGAND